MTSSQAGERGPSRPGRDPWIELDRSALVANVRAVRERCGDRPVMAVVKANAYGHGLAEMATALAADGIQHFMVAKLDEARALREAGIEGMVLNAGPFDEDRAEDVIRLGVSQAVFDDRYMLLGRVAAALGLAAHVQVKVDTGLRRLGVPHETAPRLLEALAATPGILLDGVFTTLSEDVERDRAQLNRLRAVCEAASARGIAVGLRHAASSAAVADPPEDLSALDLVRPGVLLYGLYPSERAERERAIHVRPVLSLKVRVHQVRALALGDSVGYHGRFVASRDERVAVLPIGYADGYPSALAGRGHALLGGRRCPIVAVFANTTVVLLGDGRCAVGDVAVLIGRQDGTEMTASEVARSTESSPYAVATMLSPLLRRLVV